MKIAWSQFDAWAYVFMDERVCNGDRHDDAREKILALQFAVLDCGSCRPSEGARACRSGSGTGSTTGRRPETWTE
jgi:hypothetical protein